MQKNLSIEINATSLMRLLILYELFRVSVAFVQERDSAVFRAKGYYKDDLFQAVSS